jgi:hypothetical protein
MMRKKIKRIEKNKDLDCGECVKRKDKQKSRALQAFHP